MLVLYMGFILFFFFLKILNVCMHYAHVVLFQLQSQNICCSVFCSLLCQRFLLIFVTQNVLRYYDDKDLAKFSAGCNVNVTVDNVVGKDIQEGGVEAMLDVEYIKALSPEIPLTFWYQAEYSLLNWVTALNNATDTPLVHSVSYGNDERQQTSSSYIFTTATQFAKAGTRGISILFASGDQGVCGRSGCGLITHHFHPDFPAACPYVTAVGGTDFLERSTIGDEQV